MISVVGPVFRSPFSRKNCRQSGPSPAGYFTSESCRTIADFGDCAAIENAKPKSKAATSETCQRLPRSSSTPGRIAFMFAPRQLGKKRQNPQRNGQSRHFTWATGSCQQHLLTRRRNRNLGKSARQV